MSIRKEKPRNYFLDDTAVPNIFIKEFMTDTPGDYVRVYLFAYMYAGLNHLVSNDDIARELGITTADVLDAWNYFEDRMVIRKYYPDPADETRFDVEFADLKGSIFGQAEGGDGADKSRPTVLLDDRETEALFKEIEVITSKMVSAGEMKKIADLIEAYKAPPALILFAYRYCLERGKRVRASYVGEIVKEWIERGIFTEKSAREYVGETDIRYDQYRQIMKALGLPYGTPTEEEKKRYDLWMDEYGLSLRQVLDYAKAGAGKRNKYDYVSKIIESEMKGQNGEGGKSSAGGGAGRNASGRLTRKKYYEEKLRKSEAAADQRKSEVYSRLPRIKTLDEQITALNLKLVSAALSGAPNKDAFARKTSAEIDRCLQEKAALMSQNGFPDGYMDIIYSCSNCKDTGVLDNGASCPCYLADAAAKG